MKTSCQFEKYPTVVISQASEDCVLGWDAILDRLRSRPSLRRIAIECYPGVDLLPIRGHLSKRLNSSLVIESAHLMASPKEIDSKFSEALGTDPVFGKMQSAELIDFFAADRLQQTRIAVETSRGPVVAIGTGASLLLAHWDLLIFVDITRREIQRRQVNGQAPSLGMDNANAPPAELYRRGYFLDWRVADRHRHRIFSQVDFWIDGNDPSAPKMLTGAVFHAALSTTSRRPFSLVPFFDPGPWGGDWMRHNFDLPDGPANYAWCFNCVPEENSLALRFGDRIYETPATNLVSEEPAALLGDDVLRRFGAEFPIRFDFLDTMNGGNLSLQVHPLAAYIRERFGMAYTQDESYYLMHAAPDAKVYLGWQEGTNPHDMRRALRAAQQDNIPFSAERYVNVWPAHRHDHFLIPAGTIHCSGRNCMVLEISATPYIFTFKLWDWERMGLDGRPRPIHLDHGFANMQWDRTTAWVRKNLVNRVTPLATGPGWREESTGLHPLQFIETRRHWFTAPVPHHTQGTVNVLNLVQGHAAIIESPVDAFPPLTVHYAETFVVPAAVGSYTLRPAGQAGNPMATIKAFVRREQ